MLASCCIEYLYFIWSDSRNIFKFCKILADSENVCFMRDEILFFTWVIDMMINFCHCKFEKTLCMLFAAVSELTPSDEN